MTMHRQAQPIPFMQVRALHLVRNVQLARTRGGLEILRVRRAPRENMPALWGRSSAATAPLGNTIPLLMQLGLACVCPALAGRTLLSTAQHNVQHVLRATTRLSAPVSAHSARLVATACRGSLAIPCAPSARSTP
jgi:hypothetical protein